METTRVFECPNCHAEIVEDASHRRTARTKPSEWEGAVLECPQCGERTEYDVGTAQGGDTTRSAVAPCPACGTVVEAYGTSPGFARHVVENRDLHDLHGR